MLMSHGRLFMALGLAMAVFVSQCYPADSETSYSITFMDASEIANLLVPLNGMMGHGGALGDVNNDGRLDLFVGGFCDRPNKEYHPQTGPVPADLYLQEPSGKFRKAESSPTHFFGRTSGAVFADLDNDGDLDLYIANNAKPNSRLKDEPQKSAQTKGSLLLRNDNGKFVDISEQSGACPKGILTARNIGVFDYNQDGLLDLFIVEDRFTKNPGSMLLRNCGNLKFEDVTTKAGLPQDIFGLGLALADLNDDGIADLFVPHSNRLFLSKKDHTYYEPESLKKTLAWQPLHNEDWPCGAMFADVNLDGHLDLLISIHGIPARNKIYLNKGLKNGVPILIDVTEEAGLATPVPVRCPHVEVQDFDNDGRPDIYLSAGWLEDGKITPLIFRNTSQKKGIPKFVAPRAIKEPMVYFPAGPSGDINGDGRIDLFLINWFANNHSRLLLNDSPKQNWLDVAVTGKKVNRMGIGAKVKVYSVDDGKAKTLLGHQEIATGYGYASGQPAVCHFGLGNRKHVDINVTLPNGRVLQRRNVPVNQKITLWE